METAKKGKFSVFSIECKGKFSIFSIDEVNACAMDALFGYNRLEINEYRAGKTK